MAGKVDAESSGMLQLRWNSHLESLQTIFQDLLDEESFVDVTLSCEGGALRAHRIILSSCSSYFRRVLCDNTCKHPVIIMRDVPLVEMQAILHFMYRGEIRVSEKQLPSLLRTACLLEIRGLAQEFFQQKPRDNTPAETAADQNNYRKRGAGCLENIDNRKIEDEDTVPVAEPKSKESKVVQSPKATRQAKVSSSSSALDLSSDTATENVDLESCKSNRSKTSAKKPLRHAAVSPVPLHVKCEQLNRLDGKDLSEQESPVPDQYPFTVLEDQASTGAVQAVCPFCFKDCKRTAELRAHIRAHTGEKPFRCDICSAPFARSAHLKRHRRVHTGERPFECLRCQKTFSRQDKLKLHMDRHRLRDMGGKTAVGRPRKTKSDDQNEEAASSSSCLPSPASAPTPTPSVELGMGQFAFPGASARPGPAQSPVSSGLPSPGLPLSFSDIGYLSLLSLSHRGLAAPPRDVPSVAKNSQELQQTTSKKPAASGGRGRGKGRPFSKESACEALLNFAQQVGGAAQSPA